MASVDHKKLYHQDLESALFQMLKREMFAVQEFDKDESETLKAFLRILKKVWLILASSINPFLVLPSSTTYRRIYFSF